MPLRILITGLLTAALVLLIHGIKTYQRVRQRDFICRAGGGYHRSKKYPAHIRHNHDHRTYPYLRSMIQLTLPDGSSWNLEDENTIEVYDHIADFLNPEYANGNTEALTEDQHLIAADAEGWCELACIDNYYEDSRIPGLSITIED